MLKEEIVVEINNVKSPSESGPLQTRTVTICLSGPNHHATGAWTTLKNSAKSNNRSNVF